MSLSIRNNWMIPKQNRPITKLLQLKGITDMRLRGLKCHPQRCILAIVNGVIGHLLAHLLKMLTKDLIIFKINSRTIMLHQFFHREKSVVVVALAKMY